MKAFFKTIGSFRHKLTRLSDDEPVTKLALAIILLLDLFILSILFKGLDDHTRQLTSPSEYVPYQCRQAFVDRGWTPATKMDKLQNLVLTDFNRYSYRHTSPFSDARIRSMHPRCAEFFKQARAIGEDKELRSLFVSRQEAAKKKGQFVRQYDRENEAYDTKLLETIANKNSQSMESLSATLKGKAANIDDLDAEIKSLELRINEAAAVQAFWALLATGDEGLRNSLIADLNRYERIYLFKELLWQLLFLLPLLALFWVWYSKSVKGGRGIQALIGAHLLVVTSIPILLKVTEVVLDLIPYHFLKELFDLLERLRIVAIWHYLVIILAIAFALFLVYLIQKKIFNKERLLEKRLVRGVCFACAKALPSRQDAACPFCGAQQLRSCKACGETTYRTGVHCVHCGQVGSDA